MVFQIRSTKRLPTLEIYKAKDGWRWHLIAINGKKIAESGEAYVKQPKTEDVVASIVSAMSISRWRVTL